MTARTFVRHGPAIPTELLHALEEDRLVFFCGAGISMGTGLPGFAGLVTYVLHERNYPVDEKGRPTTNVAARDAFCRDQFDKVLEIIERGEPPDSWMMRRAIIARLVKPLEPSDDVAQLELHRAILALAKRRDRTGGYRLVTTNFDDRFELAGVDNSRIEQAPRLSPPSRRDLVNLVHLHGRIDKTRPEANGADLVLTSADFGNAYLHHGWAARFVIELFREFTVLFIGYGLNDPVMRYLVDALAATPSRFRKAYALASYRMSREGDHDHQNELWSAKNAIPILYAEDHPEHLRHALLRETLVAWAAEREAGLTGRLTVAVRATANPFVAGQNEASDPDGVNAVAWALSDPNGGVARQFADAEPVPDSSWWDPVLAATIRDPRDAEKICQLTDLENVAEALAAWGCHCLATKEIVAWAIDHQGSIFRQLLNRLPWVLSRDDAAHVIPEPYRRFWEIVLHLSDQHPDPRADWHHDLPHEDGRLTSKGREILLRRLRPRLSMKKPWRYTQDQGLEPVTRLAQLAALEVDFSVGYPEHRIVRPLQSVTDDDMDRGRLLAGLADDLTSALLEHLRLGELADLPFARGASYRQRQQIAAPLDEIEPDDWRVLIDLLVKAVANGKDVAPELIKPCCRRWHLLWKIYGYSLFLRLWLFAVSEWKQFNVGPAIDLISQPEHLWSFELRSEVFRTFARRGRDIDEERLTKLAQELKVGPPKSLWRHDVDDQEIAGMGNRMRGDRLAALAEAEVTVPGLEGEQEEAAQTVYEHRDSLKRDGYQVGEHGTPLSTGRSGWVEPPSVPDLAEASVAEVVRRIITYRDEWGRDDGARKLLADAARRSTMRIIEIADELRNQGERRLAVWSGLWNELWDASDFSRVVELGANLIGLVNRNACLLSSDSILSFCRLISKLATNDVDEAVLWQLWDRAFPVAIEHGRSGVLSDRDDLNRSINAPGGVLAEVLLSRLGKASQEAGAGFPDPIGERLHRLVEDRGDVGRYSRILLASRLRWLHHLDPGWTRRMLIDRMGWSADDLEETGRLWRGYLFSPRISSSLLDDLKPMLLEAPEHHDRVGEQFDQLCYLITAITCVEAPDRFGRDEKQEVIRAMGPEGLGHGVWLLKRQLAASEDAAKLWRSRIGAWIEQCWPDDQAFHDEPLLRRIDELLLETREAFPEALAALRDKGLIQRHEIDWMTLHLLANPSKGRANDEVAFDYIQVFTREAIMWLGSAFGGASSLSDWKDSLKEILLKAMDADAEVVILFEYGWLKTFTV